MPSSMLSLKGTPTIQKKASIEPIKEREFIMSMYILVAIIFGVVAGIVARAKGHNSLGWFVAGLIIGPFALVVAVLPAKPKEGMLEQCPACCEIIRSEASLCRFCGTQLE